MQPVLFVSHGGGPMPLLGDPDHQSLVENFQEIRSQLTTPDAIILFSAHWEEPSFTVSFNPNPGMLYDYYNYPPESYNIQYPAPSNTELAQEVFDLLSESGLEVKKEFERGYDHGTFVPLSLLFPEADIPVVPISLKQDLNPQQHIQLGKALSSLRKKNILCIGSGMQFHNLRILLQADAAFKQKTAQPFTDWLDNTLSRTDLSEQERSLALSQWADIPEGRLNHPREEHLIPLHVSYGAASSPVTQIFKSQLLDTPVRCYLWQ